MRLFQFLALAVVPVFSFAADAAADLDANAAADTNSTEPLFANTDFGITYTINRNEEGAVVSVFNEDTSSIEYTLTNRREDIAVSVVGVGGVFKDIATMKPLYNLTDSAVGPVPVEPLQNGTFTQKVDIDMNPATYMFDPIVYISVNGVMYVVTPTPSFVIIEDKPISVFDPQLLMALTAVAAMVGGAGYIAYVVALGPYLRKKLKPKKAKKESAKKEKKEKKETVKTVDESWLPDHLKKKKKN